jgi:autotransporter-associated beta strand protein
VAAILVVATPQAQGASYSWSVSSGDWSLASNWGGTLPGSSDDAYVINGGTLDLHVYRPTVATLGGSGTILNAAGGTSNLSLLTVTGGGTFSGSLQDGPTNRVTLTLDGGTLVLSGSDSYTGETTIEAGTLIVACKGAITDGTRLTVGAGAAFVFDPSTGGSALADGRIYAALPEEKPVAVPGPGTLALLTIAGGIAAMYRGFRWRRRLCSTGRLRRPVYAIVRLAGLAAALLLFPSAAAAAALTWDADSGTVGPQDGGGVWNTTSNFWWTGTQDTAWNNASDAVFGAGNGSAGTVSVGSVTVGNLTFNPASSGAYTLNNGTINLSGTPTITVAAPVATISSAIAANNGLVKAGSGALNLLGNANVSGSFTVSAGTLNQTGTLIHLGPGQVLIDGATYVLIGTGQLYTPCFFYVGYSGIANFNQVGGSCNPYYDGMCIGFNRGASGSYNLSGTGQLSAGSEYVGCSGSGAFAQSGGVNVVPGSVFSGLSIGYSLGASGSYNLSGGSLSAGFEWIGESGTGTFTQSGGTHNAGQINLGCPTSSSGTYAAGAAGTYNLNGSGLLTAGVEYVGNSVIGTFNHSAGTNSVSSLYLAYGSSGTYNAGGTGFLSAGTEYLGYSGTGTLAQTGGTNSVSNLYLGSNSNSAGIYNLSGSGQLSANNEYLGNPQSSGTFLQSGGTNLVGSLLQLEGSGLGGSAVYTLTGSGCLVVSPSGSIGIYGGRFQWLNPDGLSSPAVTVSGGLLEIGFNFDVAALTGSASFHGTKVSGGPIAITNGATATLSGTTAAPFGLIVGTSTGSGTLQQTGGVAGGFTLGYDPGSSGTYNLSGSGQVSAILGYVGYSGNGKFNQLGGANNLVTNGTDAALYLGYNTWASGTYNLTAGALNISMGREYVGYSGSGTLTQTGGTNTVTPDNLGDGLYLGFNSGSAGTYVLSGSGQLSAQNEYVGYSGVGTFSQSGGFNNISGYFTTPLYLGYSLSGSGKYTLGGGSLSATAEYVGYAGNGAFLQSGGLNSTQAEYVGYSPLSVSSYAQSGGTNNAAFLAINSLSRYQLSGGTLQLSGGLALGGGTFDCGHGSAAITLSGIVDLSAGTITNAESTSLAIGANSLLIVPPGYNLNVVFGHYSSSALLHTAGTTLTIAASQSIGGWGTISDPVVCQGTIAAGNRGFINLTGGELKISGTGNVSLGTGTLIISSSDSGMSGGALSATDPQIGSSGNGTFTQTGGASTFTDVLYLGYNATDVGVYNLSGPSQMSVNGLNGLMLGNSGTGVLNQSGGVNSAGTHMWLGYNAGAVGVYNLSGTGLVSVGAYEIIGFSGSGTFTQTGGTNSVIGSSDIILGYSQSSSGVYNLNGGVLYAAALRQYSGAATLNFGGGTLKAAGYLWVTVPMTINSGGAIFDTNYSQIRVTSPIGGSGGLTTVGSGTLVLAGTDTYAGDTVINFASIQVASTTALPYGPGKGNLLVGGTLDLGGFSANVNGLSGAGVVTSSATGSLTFTVGCNDATSSFGGCIRNGSATALSLVKVGGGELILSGTDTYTGGTTVNAGKLFVTNPSALADGSNMSVGANASQFFAGSLQTAPVAGDVQAAPEPSTLALLGVAVCSAVVSQRVRSRRRKQ